MTTKKQRRCSSNSPLFKSLSPSISRRTKAKTRAAISTSALIHSLLWKILCFGTLATTWWESLVLLPRQPQQNEYFAQTTRAETTITTGSFLFVWGNPLYHPPPPPRRRPPPPPKRILTDTNHSTAGTWWGKSQVLNSTKTGDTKNQEGEHSDKIDERVPRREEERRQHVSEVIQLTETEVWDGTKWRAPGVLLLSLNENKPHQPHDTPNPQHHNPDGGRWSNERGELCLSPSKQAPPPGTHWDGEWKILTHTATRDGHGWEYSHAQPYPYRQRIWLRSVQNVPTATITEKSNRVQRKTSRFYNQYRSTTKPKHPFFSTGRKSSNKTKESTASASLKDNKKQKKQKMKKTTAKDVTTTGAKQGDHRGKNKTDMSNQKIKQKRKRNKLVTSYSRLLRAVADDFNFKGFGVSFWKGIVFPESIGVSFRVPLTAHFSTWDGNPALPKASLSVGFFYPPMVGLAVSGSLGLAWIKWWIGQVWFGIQFWIWYFLWTVYRGLLLATSAMVFPVTRTLINPPFPLARPWGTDRNGDPDHQEIGSDSLSGNGAGGKADSDSFSSSKSPPSWFPLRPPPAGPVFPRDYDERIGCTYGWRFSATRGYYTTFRGYHCYSPTMVSLWRLADRFTEAVVSFASHSTKTSASLSSTKNTAPEEASIGSSSKRRATLLSRMPKWIVRRSADLMFEISGPVPTEPFFSGSTGLSLSGFYFQPRKTSSSSSQVQSQQPETDLSSSSISPQPARFIRTTTGNSILTSFNVNDPKRKQQGNFNDDEEVSENGAEYDYNETDDEREIDQNRDATSDASSRATTTARKSQQQSNGGGLKSSKQTVSSS